MIAKLRKKLSFRSTVIILLLVAIILAFLFGLLAPRVFDSSPSEFGETVELDFSFNNSADGTPAENNRDLSQVDLTEKQYSILSVMPFYSEQFNVTYRESLDEFQVYINPSSGVTQQEVRNWFKSFIGVAEEDNVLIKFIDTEGRGAPVVVN